MSAPHGCVHPTHSLQSLELEDGCEAVPGTLGTLPVWRLEFFAWETNRKPPKPEQIHRICRYSTPEAQPRSRPCLCCSCDGWMQWFCGTVSSIPHHNTKFCCYFFHSWSQEEGEKLGWRNKAMFKLEQFIKKAEQPTRYLPSGLPVLFISLLKSMFSPWIFPFW